MYGCEVPQAAVVTDYSDAIVIDQEACLDLCAYIYIYIYIYICRERERDMLLSIIMYIYIYIYIYIHIPASRGGQFFVYVGLV